MLIKKIPGLTFFLQFSGPVQIKCEQLNKCLRVLLKLCNATHARWQGEEVNSCKAGNALAPFLWAGVCAWCSSSTFLRPGACACRSWQCHHHALFLHSSSSFPSQLPDISALPGTWCCFHPLVSPFHSLPLPSERQSLSGLNNPPMSSLTKFLLFFAATPHAPPSLLWALLGSCHVNPAPHRVATTSFPAVPLVPSPGARSTTIISSVHSFLQPHGCLLCTPTPARLSSLLPALSRAWPFPLVQRAKKGGTCFQQDFLLPHSPGRGQHSRGSFV